jgi:hypothetical protein
MPLTLIITDGLLPHDRQSPTMARLSEAFLELHGLKGNSFLTPNVIGHIQVLPVGSTYSGLQETPVAIIEWMTPSFAFTSREIQIAYVEAATEIVYQACGGKHPHERIWVNLTHAVDGMWGIAGKAFTNEGLGLAVAAGSHP